VGTAADLAGTTIWFWSQVVNLLRLSKKGSTMARTEKVTALQTEISTSEVSKRIYTLRGCQVMLDQDLSKIYEVELRVLKQAVRRNIERFPKDFVFEPSKDELESLKSQSVISNVENFSEPDARPCLRSQIVISNPEGKSRGRGGSRYTPFAFCEPGVAMLSSVLHSPRAIQVNIAIIRIFIELRRVQRSHLDVVPKLESLETKLMQRFDQLQASFQSKPLVAQPIAKHHPVSHIQSAVARHFGLTSEDLKSSSRTQAMSLPRHIAIYLLRKHLGLGFSEIGRHFGGRDHTTILHSYRKILADAETNTMIRTAVDALGNEILPFLT
jgi:hypothetical protein